MGERLVVEAPGRRKPLASLPRGRAVGEWGGKEDPVVELDVEFGRRAAGCCICSVAIPPKTTRLLIRLWLRNPVEAKDGSRRLTETYYAHPGCITDRVRPEVIRTRMDCYDCGAIPPQESGVLICWHERCFTVSKFASAPLCPTCSKKPRWKRCEACNVLFPHWMISDVAETRDVPVAHLEQYADLSLKEQNSVCEFCAKRLGVSTVSASEEAKAEFDRIRAEIAEHGVL